MYSHEKYLKNKNRILEYQRQDRLKHKDKRQKHRKEYENKSDIKQRRKEQSSKWKLDNPEKVQIQKKKDDKKYYEKNKKNMRFLNKKRAGNRRYELEHKEKRRAYRKAWSQKPEVKARRNLLARIRNKNNPRSNRSYSLDLQLIMNNVRLRDNNTCQWQGCNLTFRESPIHVHHIFPRSEYPELELMEKYMICYCANHHGMFHRYRGDSYSEMISWKEENDQYVMENYH